MYKAIGVRGYNGKTRRPQGDDGLYHNLNYLKLAYRPAP
jgi:hypothetical protein